MEIIHNLSNEEYHSEKTRVSSTWLKILSSGTPKDLKTYLEGEQEEKKCLSVGQLAHSLILENNIDRFVVTPEFNCGSNAGKQEYYDYLKDWDSMAYYELMQATGNKPKKDDLDSLLGEIFKRENKIIVDEKDLETIKAMRESVMANPTARRWIEGGIPEITSYYTCEHTGLACKARADILNEKDSVIPDLKTHALGMDDHSLMRVIMQRGYHISMEHYIPAFNNEFRFPLIFVSTKPPHYHCRIINISGDDNDFRRLGASKRFEGLYKIKECMETGEWPGYSPEPTVINPPKWAQESIEVEADYDY